MGPDSSESGRVDDNLIAYVASLSAQSNKYCKYLPVSVNNSNTAALIDSGNLWGSVISTSFFLRLGLTRDDLRPARATTVGTAKAGASMQIWGVPKKPLSLRIGGQPTQLRFQPTVVEGLTMDVNLGGSFLKQHGIDQLHSKDALRFQGRLLSLYADPREFGARDAVYSMAYVKEGRVVPAHSICLIELRVPEIERAEMQAGDGFLTGCPEFEEKTDLNAVRDALVSASPDGHIVATVMNSSPNDIVLPAGCKYGEFTKSCSLEDAEDNPDKICFIEPNSVPRKKKKLEEKMEEAPPSSWPESRRREWLAKEFKIAENPCLATPEAKETALLLLLDYWDVFSIDGSFGKTDLLEHASYTEEVPPSKCG